MDEKKIVVVIPSYNNEKNYRRNLDSVFRQNYRNYRVLYFDDCSTDNTYQLVMEYLDSQPEWKRRTQLYRSLVNSKQSCHKYMASRICQDDEIMVFLDGDDWLKHPYVFQVLNQVYSTSKVWVTYGSFEIYRGKNKIGRSTWCHQVPKNVIKKGNYRQSNFCTSHLKTCYAWLYKQIPMEYLLGPNGKFLPFGTDVAEMRCLIELAGPRNKFIPHTLYVYNEINSGLYQTANKKRRNNQKSLLIRQHIKTMPPLSRIKSPIKYGITLNSKLELSHQLVPLELPSNANSLDNEHFYLYVGSGSVSKDLVWELALKYMINCGVDLFIFQLSNKPTVYNLVSYRSEYSIAAVSLEQYQLNKTDLMGGYICTRSGHQKLERLVFQKNKDKEHQKLKFGQKMMFTIIV